MTDLVDRLAAPVNRPYADSMAPADALHQLVDELRRRGFRVIAPVARGDELVLGEIRDADELPWGVGIVAGEHGGYRLTERRDRQAFAISVGPASWRTVLLPSSYSAHSPEGPPSGDEPPLALLGMRPCDLRALAILDRADLPPDAASAYAIRRARSFVVVVECTEPAASCFCVSAGAGPRVGDGAADEDLRYDLKLTETVGRRGGVRYVARTGSCLGAEVFRAVAHVPANHHTAQTAHAAVSEAATRIHHSGRALPTVDISALLAATAEARTWDVVSSLCTACGDCAVVCPTGAEPDSWRTPEDYRRWLTDRFDAAACVGCGRCVLACPVGIDPVTLLGALQQDWELEAQDE